MRRIWQLFLESCGLERRKITYLHVPRRFWARGEIEPDGGMYRSTRFDIVGYYLNAIGCSAAGLAKAFSPGTLRFYDYDIPQEANWLLSKKGGLEGSSSAFWDIISTNDVVQLSDAEREERLADLFWKHGRIVLTFGDNNA